MCPRGMGPLTLLMLFVMGAASPAHAYLDLVGYDDLIAMLGDAAPDGSGVKVAHVESEDSDDDYAPFTPDSVPTQFAGKTITLLSGDSGVSGHARNTASIFFSLNSSIASGVTEIDSYHAGGWLSSDFLRGFGSSLKPRVTDARVANHSWIIATDSPDTSLLPALRKLDWVVMVDDFIQVGGEANSGTSPDITAASFNTIVVGQTSGGSSMNTQALDETYVAGRAKPDIVAPGGSTSAATPMVASAATALVQFAHDNPSLSEFRSHTNRAGNTIYQAETSEAIKAVLMAGAERYTYNRATDNTAPDMTDYRSIASLQTANGLDYRYGAGQVNVFHSYNMLAAGQTDSQQDGGGPVGTYGYDYDESFGGAAGSNTVASYTFTATPGANLLTSTLAWNLFVEGGNGILFDGDTTLHNLDLELYDMADPDTPIAWSSSTIDNTENLRIALDNNHAYELRVTADTATGLFNHDYAIGWRLVPDQGDWDHDGDLDADDIDTLTAAVGSNELQFDLNLDGVVNTDDRSMMVSQFIRTNTGDANLDGIVSIADLALLSETFGAPGGWADGDFSGDGLVDIADLALLSENFGASDTPDPDAQFAYDLPADFQTLLATGSTGDLSGFSLTAAIPAPASLTTCLLIIATCGRGRRSR